MNETNFDWDDLKLFLAVARGGGLAQASRYTGKSPPTLGRRMQHLEMVTSSELFRRLPRGYELTEQGRALFEKVVALEQQIVPLDRSNDQNHKVLVKISAGSWMTHALCQKAGEILGNNSAAQLRFISAEHVLDISRRETVIGIRNSRPEQLGLACKKVGRVKFAGYAADKSVKQWAHVLGNTPSSIWLAQNALDCVLIEVTAPRNALDLAYCGVARALLPTFIGDRQVRLTRVTACIDDLSHDQWLVTHQEERFVPQVRQTIDRIYDVVAKLHKPN